MFSLRNTSLALLITLGVAAVLAQPTAAQEKSIIVASTTSTRDSGLFDHLLPILKQKTGITVNVVAVGTGQALDLGRHGEADVVFVHAKLPELTFISEGQGVKRYPVMYNDFVLVGPKNDPAHIVGTDDVAEALTKIKNEQAPFLSRDGLSGTSYAELALWNKDAGINIEKERGPWYTSTHQGMGATLKAAAASNAYTLSDRGTWLSFKSKGDLAALVEGDAHLVNRYDVILLDPKRHAEAKIDAAYRLADWLLSPAGQAAIGSYKIDGEQLFHPFATEQ